MLTTDGVLSFAVMNYAEFGLDEDEFYGTGHVGVYGYRTGRYYQHPNSNRPAIVNIANETGNTGQLGQWVFRTDDLNAATRTTTTTSTSTTGTPTGVQQPMYCVEHVYTLNNEQVQLAVLVYSTLIYIYTPHVMDMHAEIYMPSIQLYKTELTRSL